MEMAGKEYSKQMFLTINKQQDLSQILTRQCLLTIGEGPGITSPLHVVWRRCPYVPREGSRNSWNCNFPSLFRHTIQVCFSQKPWKLKKPPEQLTDDILALILSCRWEEEGNNTISKFPRVAAPNGLHIRVQDYWTCETFCKV
jgi:hypothetical protein